MNNEVLVQKQSLLAWSLLAIVVLMVILFLVIPVLSYSSELSDDIDRNYRQLVKMRQITNTTPQFMQEYDRVRSQGLDKLFYPEGMTSAQVAKELQEHLAKLIARGNGTLISSEVIDELQDDNSANPNGYSKVTVRAVFRAQNSLLRDVLYQSYKARPLLFVDELEVRPAKNVQPNKQVVKADVKISTYWQGGQEEQP